MKISCKETFTSGIVYIDGMMGSITEVNSEFRDIQFVYMRAELEEMIHGI
jgi:hypothetical protein